MIKITCLIENSTFRMKLRAQQGVSLLVETFDKKILFDVGQDYKTLKHNADILNIDLNSIDAIMISHKDWDHIGALPDLLKNLDSTPEVYLIDDYAEIKQPLNRKFNIEDWSIIKNYSNLNHINDSEEIFPNIFITKPIQADVKESGLLINDPNGSVLLVGCSHPGIDTMITIAQEQALYYKLRGVIGGCHLVQATSDQLQENVDFVKKSYLEFIIPMHCSGYKFNSLLQQQIPEVLKLNSLGVFGVGNVTTINKDFSMSTVLGSIK